MNQIIAVVILFGIITAVFVPLISESALQIFSKSTSISDILDTSRHRAGQIMVSTGILQNNETTSIFLSNIGLQKITIHTVLVDGILSPHTLIHQDDTQSDVFHPDDLGILKIPSQGDVIHVITDSGKLFEFHMP